MRRLESEAYRRHVTMAVDEACDVAVNASAGITSVALANVLDNAVKFSETGGRVSVRVTADDREAVVAVSATGPGVLPEEIPLIFERFHRGSAPRATGTRGVGLGLAICRTLIERQGGRISVSSTPGQGATFVLRFPLVSDVQRVAS